MPIILPSATTPWASMYADVVPHVPQCPTFEIEDYLRKAATDFFRASCIWRGRDLTLLTTVASQATYAYALPADARLNLVHVAYDGEDEIDVEEPGSELDYFPGETNTTLTIGVGEDRASFRVTPAPEAAATVIKGTVSYIPSVDASGILTWVFNDYRHEIAAGAAAMLVIQKDRPWTAPSMYGGLMAAFNDGVTRASHLRGATRRKPIRVRPV